MNTHKIIHLDQRIKNGKELEITITTSLEDVEYFVNMLKEEVKKQNANFSILKQACIELISRLPLPIYYLDGFVLRSRPKVNGENFKTAADISYNPVVDKIELGRFNMKGESVFYAAAPIHSNQANGALTTICESMKELFNPASITSNLYTTIGKWNIIKPIPLIMLSFYDEAWRKSLHIQNINPPFAEFINLSCNDEDTKKCQLFLNYFSECAGKRFDTANNYLLTTAFYHALREQYGHSEMGILYSSSMTENYGINIVLSKEIIDKNYLELDLVTIFKCERSTLNAKKFKIYPYCEAVKVDKNGEFILPSIS